MSAATSASRTRPAPAGLPREGAEGGAQAAAGYSILYTATLCLMAAGAVMVYSASSAESLLGESGDPAFYLKRYLIVGVIGLAVMYGCSRMDLRALKVITPLLLLVGFVLTAALHIPGLGVEVNGATRWIGVAGCSSSRRSCSSWAWSSTRSRRWPPGHRACEPSAAWSSRWASSWPPPACC